MVFAAFTRFMSSISNTLPLSEHDTRVHELLSHAEGEFGRAAQFMREYGVSTDLAQQASNILTAPLEFCYQTFENLSDKVAQMLRPIVEAYLRRVSEVATIANIWFVNRGEGAAHELEYTIVLHEYTLEHRAMLREFRLGYEDSGLDSMVPLAFNIIPESFANRIDESISSKIDLA